MFHVTVSQEFHIVTHLSRIYFCSNHSFMIKLLVDRRDLIVTVILVDLLIILSYEILIVRDT